MPEITETQIYHAWRALESVRRGAGDSVADKAQRVQPAMDILEQGLDELGFAIDKENSNLIEKPPEDETEKPPEGGESPVIDNTLPDIPDPEKPPPGTGGPPLGGEPPVIDNTLPPEGTPQSAQQSSMFKRRK